MLLGNSLYKQIKENISRLTTDDIPEGALHKYSVHYSEGKSLGDLVIRSSANEIDCHSLLNGQLLHYYDKPDFIDLIESYKILSATDENYSDYDKTLEEYEEFYTNNVFENTNQNYCPYFVLYEEAITLYEVKKEETIGYSIHQGDADTLVTQGYIYSNDTLSEKVGDFNSEWTYTGETVVGTDKVVKLPTYPTYLEGVIKCYYFIITDSRVSNDNSIRTVALGKVETLESGREAYVHNSGNNQNLILDFGLPRGKGVSSPDNQTVVVNTNDNLEVIGRKAKTGDVLYDWIGTTAQWKAGRQNGTIKDNYVCLITDDGVEVDTSMEYTLNNPYSLFDYKYTFYGINNLSWLLAGAYFYSGAKYQTLYQKLLAIHAGTEFVKGVTVKLITEEYDDFDFVLNLEDSTFRLPLRTRERFLIDTIVSGTSWCKIYSDGYCEQGCQEDTTAKTLYFLKQFKSPEYVVGGVGVSVSGVCRQTIGAKEEASFTTNYVIEKCGTGGWVARGYLKETEYTKPDLYFYVGEIAKQDYNLINLIPMTSVDWGNITGTITNQADLIQYLENRFGKIDEISENMHPINSDQIDNSWYVEYSNGIIEQGGKTDVLNYQEDYFVELLKHYTTDEYHISGAILCNEGECSWSVHSLTPQNFKIKSNVQSGNAIIFWRAYGK